MPWGTHPPTSQLDGPEALTSGILSLSYFWSLMEVNGSPGQHRSCPAERVPTAHVQEYHVSNTWPLKE